MSLVGRIAELAEVAAVLAHAAKGQGRMLTLEGEAGIGKTFLLEEALAQASAGGFRCFVGAAEELERHRPFGVIAESLGVGRRGRPSTVAEPGVAGAGSEIVRLLAGDGPSTGTALLPGAPEAEFRIVDALIDFVEHLCTSGPVVIALEDLHWSDPSTLLALNRLAREIHRLPVALICTLRPLPRSADLQSLLEGLSGRGAVHLRLGALDEASIAALVEAILGARPGRGLLGQLARAGGNPFFATELVASLQQAGAITLVDDVAEAAGAALPSSLTSTILHRLSFLSEEALETLQVASILGSSFSVADLAAVVGRATPLLMGDLEAAARAGILRSEGRLLTFRHDLIREVLYHGMPLAVRHALHLAAAHALEEAGLPPEELAEHVVRGAVAGDLYAIDWLRMAAHQAGTRSPTVAAELLERALELAGGSPDVRDALEADLALYLVQAGRLAETERICHEVLERGHDPDVEGTLRLCLVQTHVGQGNVAESLQEIEQAVRSPGLSRRERARLLAWSSTCRVIIWDLEGAAAHADLALSACRDIGDDLGHIIALANLAAVQNLRGHFAPALALAEDALAQARRSRSPGARRLQLTLLHALTLIDVDQLEEAQHILRRGRFARERRGARWNLASYHFVSALGRFLSGEWDEAIAQFDTAVDFSEEAVVRQGELVGHSVRSMIALHRGDRATAEQEAAAAEADAESSGPQWRADWMLWARSLLLEAQHRRGEALRLLTKAWELCSGAGVVAEFPMIGPDLVRLARGGGEPILAADVTTALESLAATAGVASVSGAALRCRGLMDADADILLQAVATYRRSPRRRDLALACEDAAAALAATGRVAEARPLAEEALEVYRGLDARHDASRAQSRLRAVGLRSGTRGERTRPRCGRESLTQAEVEVVSRVAEGLSNPEIARRLFISRRTVQSHVSHALEKLNVSSRVELAVETARWQAADRPSAWRPEWPAPRSAPAAGLRAWT